MQSLKSQVKQLPSGHEIFVDPRAPLAELSANNFDNTEKTIMEKEFHELAFEAKPPEQESLTYSVAYFVS